MNPNDSITGVVIRIGRSFFVLWDDEHAWFIDLSPEDTWPVFERAVQIGRRVRLTRELGGSYLLQIKLRNGVLSYPRTAALISPSSRETIPSWVIAPSPRATRARSKSSGVAS